MGGIQAKQKESRDKRQELNDMKKKLGFQSEAEIDAEGNCLTQSAPRAAPMKS